MLILGTLKSILMSLSRQTRGTLTAVLAVKTVTVHQPPCQSHVMLKQASASVLRV